ncbi:MAG: winged helix-turn-helix transcriptional regulator [Candidatus Lokiarchaeota archaeon]|nr:winged helix-turn-helix transcriptional regulator [Candidatus Lokiarchaeota archaeon]
MLEPQLKTHIFFAGVSDIDKERIKTSLLVFITFLVALIAIFIAITLREYKNHITRKTVPIHSNRYLTIDDVFENEYRKKIISKIIEQPGIHNNELLRQCNMQNGQLKWHLDVLVQYNIIKQVNIGQYNTFYPIISLSQDLKIEECLLSKSKTTLSILDIIKQKPGITSSSVARHLKLARSTLKYHVDKLMRKDLISLHRSGRKIKLYPNQLEK